MTRAGTEHRRMRQRCEAAVRSLDVPVPFDVGRFCELLGQQRGRPIRLTAISSPVDPCGVWLDADSGDWIFYESGTSWPHQKHIILHELSHLICDHHASGDLDEERFRGLFPDLDVGVIRSRMDRSSYTDEQEQEAELLATLILERAERGTPERRSVAPPAVATILDRLEATLGEPGAA